MADLYNTFLPSSQMIGHLWKTSIQPGIKGGEKRNALFTWPRIKIESSYDIHEHDQMNWIFRKLYRHTHEIWGFPLWPDKTLISSQAASGQKIIDVGSTADRHFYEDREIIIVDPSDLNSYEVAEIDSMTASQITVKVNLLSTWAIGSYVMPVYDCRILSKNSIKREAYKHYEFIIEGTEAFESSRAFTYSLPASGADQYYGWDILLHEPVAPLEFQVEHPFSLTQFLGRGFSYSYFEDDNSHIFVSMQFKENSRSEIFSLYNFFDSKRGRFDYFWQPSWNRDIIVNAAIGAADVVLNVDDIEYPTYFLTNDYIGRHIYIRLPDKSYVCRKITGATSNTIGIDSAIGTAVSSGDLDKLLISFLHWSRFAIDELTLDYSMDNKAVAQVSAINIIDDLPVDLSTIDLTIDSSKIDSDLTDFPVLVHLSDSSGITSEDVSVVFNRLGSDANRLKISVTDQNLVECYVEVEKWDHANKEAWLWVCIPSVLSGSDISLSLFFNPNMADNTDYVGDTGSAPAQQVWDSNFKGVWHMAQDPNGDVVDAIKDSTINQRDATPHGSMTSTDLVDASIGKGIDFDESDDFLSTENANDVLNITDTVTLEAIVIPNYTLDSGLIAYKFILSRQQYPNISIDSYVLFFNLDGKLQFGTLGGNIQSTKASWIIDIPYVLTGTYDSSGFIGNLFVDGVKEVLTVDNYDVMNGGINSLTIGAESDNQYFFPGIIDEVRISDTIRSDAWIKATYYSNIDGLVTYTI